MPKLTLAHFSLHHGFDANKLLDVPTCIYSGFIQDRVTNFTFPINLLQPRHRVTNFKANYAIENKASTFMIYVPLSGKKLFRHK